MSYATSGNSESQVDSMFITQLQLLADKYGCTIGDIDLENNIIDINCPDEVTDEYAVELSRIFDKYLV